MSVMLGIGKITRRKLHMLPNLTLVLGGAASGKSALAEALVTDTGAPRIYIATAQAFDDEMSEKIAAHRAMRGPDWQTFEASLDLAPILAQTRADQVVLLDCATLWLSNQMLAERDIDAAVADLIDALSQAKARIVVVSNEVGQSGVPDNALARKFRNAQGQLNQNIARNADLVIAVMAGLPLVLKGEIP